MDRSPNDPTRGTQPIKRPSTRPLGDSFVATNKGQQAAPSGPGTRPLAPTPGGPLKQIVPPKLEELRRELDGIQRLITIFTMPIQVLRYAMYLSDPPPPPPPKPAPVLDFDPFGGMAPRDDDASQLPAEASLESLGMDYPGGQGHAPGAEPVDEDEDPFQEEEDPIPPEFRALNPNQRVLALEVSEVLKADIKVKQRAQVALHQYEEAVRAQEEGHAKLQSLYQMTYEDAWDRIPDISIERIKGKAYPISGFFDHFKRDPVISRVFPPPRNQPAQGTAPLAGIPGLSGPSAQAPKAAPPPQVGGDGLLGKLKGLFGKL